MTYEEMTMLTADESDTIVYISDPETYELLYLNKSAIRLLGKPDRESWYKKPCYKIIQGKDSPCEFCNMSTLTQDEFFKWDFYNPSLGRYFNLRDKLIDLDGKLVKLEIAMDVTEKHMMHQMIRKKLKSEETLVKCIQTLNQDVETDESIGQLLEIIGNFYDAERAYIFEADYKSSTISNTYEWCRQGVDPQKQGLQNLPIETADIWTKGFKQEAGLYSTSLESIEDKESRRYRILKQRGVRHLLVVPLRTAGGETMGFLGLDNPGDNSDDMLLLRSITCFIVDDINKRKMMRQLKQLSYRDGLTQMWNRNRYIEVIKELQSSPPANLGVIYVDINGLKIANDTYGHEYGDYRIHHTAGILGMVFEQGIYRIGGDEFVVLLPGVSREEFEDKVERLRDVAEMDQDFDVSLGWLWNEDESMDPQQQIIRADELMYVDKQNYYSTLMEGRQSHRSGMLKELLKEIKDGRFMVYLQPKVAIKSGELTGAEALCRRIGEKGEVILPSRFVPLFEAEGIIRHVDFFVLETVCRLLNRWKKEGKPLIKLAVNLSRITMMEHNVAGRIKEVCGSWGVEPRYIEIEMTESIGELGTYELTGLLGSLREAGFTVSLDDFGSKYSNLAILVSQNFNEVKLDKSLIDQLVESEKSRIVTEHAINICRELERTSIVAEGIETQGQRDVLERLNCDVGQGFLFGRPVSIKEFEEKYLMK